MRYICLCTTFMLFDKTFYNSIMSLHTNVRSPKFFKKIEIQIRYIMDYVIKKTPSTKEDNVNFKNIMYTFETNTIIFSRPLLTF